MAQEEKKAAPELAERARVTPELREYVAQNAPGPGSELKLKRAQTMGQVVAGLKKWCETFDITVYGNRLQPSAYFGSTVMPDEASAHLMSRYTAWLFFLDYCTDESRTLEELEDHCQQIMRAFVSHPPAPLQKKKGLGGSLAEAFTDILQELTRDGRRYARNQTATSLGYSLAIFEAEAAAVVHSMYWERKQTLRYVQQGRGIPRISMEEYMAHARYSVAARAAVALSLVYEEDPLYTWNRWQRATELGSDVVRLTNDLANIQREFEEGKLNAVSLTLLKNGWDGQTPPVLHSRERREAVAEVRALHKKALDQFLEEIKTLSGDKEKPVYHNALGGVSFAMAMYEKGDFEIPDSQDLTSGPSSEKAS